MTSVALRIESPEAARAVPREKIVRLRGCAFVADPSGVLFWPEERLLIVADLHLEKGSAYAARRVFLPPYDTTATLARLAEAIQRLAPRRVVALGDSFHDGEGAARLRPHDVQALRALQVGRDWVWVAGNHDPGRPAGLDGDHLDALAIGPIRLCHEPSDAPDEGEIAGHLHPSAIVAAGGGAVRRRCFLADEVRCILPAFGTFAGGLNILDATFARHFGGGKTRAHVLGRNAVYSVGLHQCLADTRSTAAMWR